MSTIIVRAVADTPPALRHLDGCTYPLRPGVTPTEPGTVGTLHGAPGVLVDHDGQLVWEIREPKPTVPEQTGVQLGDVLAALTEISDLLKERLPAKAEPSEAVKQADELGKALEVERALQVPAGMINLPSFGMTLADYRRQVEEQWSAPGADDSASSSATGTTCTGHCDAKA